MIITFQEFQKHEADRAKWLGSAIAQYRRSDEYKIAEEAELYEKQQNTAINGFVKKVYDITGVAAPDITSQNNRIASNFFHRLTVQRVSYSLGNGVSFANKKKEVSTDGKTTISDPTKYELGNKFDDVLFNAGLYAVQQGKSYVFDNDGDYYLFPMTEFMPILDEETGELRAGARFWCLEWRKRPVIVELYEEDGRSVYKTAKGKYGLGALELAEEKQPYKLNVQTSEADGDEPIGSNNYSALPIAVMYGNKAGQSALVGMKANIDAYDMIHSGFANDLTDCAQMYWIVNNAAGMDDDDVRKLRERMLFQHVVVTDQQNSEITPYTQEIPYNSREACLNRIKASIYRDFGALDVENIASQAVTATQIRAAYQAMDEEADAFEYQVNAFVQQILALKGIENDYPLFDRNRISNEKEETEMIMLAAQYLDAETILRKLPFITVDEIDGIMAKQDKLDNDTFTLEDGE